MADEDGDIPPEEPEAPELDFQAPDGLLIRLSEPVEGLGESDFTVDFGETGGSTRSFTDRGGGVYSICIQEVSAAGEITVSVFKDGFRFTPAERSLFVGPEPEEPEEPEEETGE